MRVSSSLVSMMYLVYSVSAATEESPSNSTNKNSCRSDVLVLYKLVFTTFWSRESFPRQYPEWRPQAHFSKLIGYSHTANFSLYREGETASAGLQQFAELGESSILENGEDIKRDNQTVAADEGPPVDKINDILDGFTGSRVPQGVGASTSMIFVDGQHPLVSAVSKLQPSPDWFVGIDSLNMCGSSGHFLDTLTVEADPLDAGTDNGFTFTSPNWPTDPKAAIFRIRNDYPAHPAGSFYYPELSELPTIATFTLVKEKEYKLSKVYVDGALTKLREAKLAEHKLSTTPAPTASTKATELLTTTIPTSSVPPVRQEVVKTADNMKNKNTNEETAAKTTSPPKARQTEPKRSTQKTGYFTSSGPKDFFKKRYSSEILKEAEEKISKIDLYKLFISDLDAGQQLHNALSSKPLSNRRGGMGFKKKHHIRKLRHSHHKHRGPRNCRVSEWGSWSSCSKSCGIGEASRTRRVIRHAKRGGKSCPSLKSVKWCGSARNCRSKYFDW